MNVWQQFKYDFSASAFIAGFITVLVSLTGPVAIIIQAAKMGDLSQAQLTSWIWAMSITSGACGLWLSLRYRTPIVCAFSTGGAALLIDALPQYAYSDVIGAYIFAAVLVVLLGASGLFSRLMQHVPRSIVSGMLAGILFVFGAHLFVSLQQAPTLVLPIILAYLIIKRVIPRYAVLAALLTGVIVCLLLGQLNTQVLRFTFVIPEATLPGLSLPALIGVAVPLAFVALASQYAPGVAVLQSSGYHHTPISPLITTTGISTILFAPFGLHGTTLAAITAAICTGPECHPDHQKRYVAAVVCGVFYIFFGLFATVVTTLFIAIPETFVASLAGLALLGALSSGLAGAMADESEREAGVITFLMTASGVSFFGVGSAFWGLIAGVVAYAILVWKRKALQPD
ncbi:benzoate transporter [Advenella kashmirensis W13003]|uniref:Benzoate transporter n=1 Tax=Advenella kashmirensis W13003 TaxID=1424334 RepID=V8QQ89_9BURK|nr:benzoate/H(+) symporter BenE family transporter [Advenella kashmirensis]ETF01812.1 benzoate transporter [Advenella kashmirensis W13003]